jgi:hypothetical protein
MIPGLAGHVMDGGLGLVRRQAGLDGRSQRHRPAKPDLADRRQHPGWHEVVQRAPAVRRTPGRDLPQLLIQRRECGRGQRRRFRCASHDSKSFRPDSLARAGRLEDATLTFEKMLTYANDLGLYSEEIGVAGEQLGNFPQAFSHLSLINAAINLDYQLDHGAGDLDNVLDTR